MIPLNIHTQPDDESCGPTSLHAIYHYYGRDISLREVLETVKRSISGGTLAPMLGQHALQHGFQTMLYINNLTIFDPTWFEKNGMGYPDILISKLTQQMKYKTSLPMIQASQAYIHYLTLGGQLYFKTLHMSLLKKYFDQRQPIITGLSATYLYCSSREFFTPQGKSIYDDIRGTPCGHFVVLCGYDAQNRHIIVADPHQANPISHDNYYCVNSHRLINAIMLGVMTYDAHLLIIQP